MDIILLSIMKLRQTPHPPETDSISLHDARNAVLPSIIPSFSATDRGGTKVFWCPTATELYFRLHFNNQCPVSERRYKLF